jgi:hypothetical protein
MNNDFEHQQNKPVQSLNKKKLKICNNFDCGYKTYEHVSRCPKCGRPIWTINESRMLMSILIPLGGIFVLTGFGVIVSMEYGISSGTSRWKGSEASLYFVYALLGAVAAFGLSVASFGLWVVIFGRPSKVLFKIMVSIFMGLLVLVGFGKLILVLLD